MGKKKKIDPACIYIYEELPMDPENREREETALLALNILPLSLKLKGLADMDVWGKRKNRWIKEGTKETYETPETDPVNVLAGLWPHIENIEGLETGSWEMHDMWRKFYAPDKRGYLVKGIKDYINEQSSL